jgi:hypothetical protein
MKFDLIRQRDPQSGDDVIRFSGEVSDRELVALPLDRLDRALLDSVSDSPADCLLALEMLFRRSAEQRSRSPEAG